MDWMPKPVDELLRAALVGELTVVGQRGEPITHPLIPLWDGDKIYMTSSVLFSKKLEHIKRNPKVAVAITNPVACGGLVARCSIQGDARVIEDDPHSTWEQVLPLWREKEPAIEDFVSKRFALPLFFERSIIEITPRRVLWWADGDPSKAPQVVDAPFPSPASGRGVGGEGAKFLSPAQAEGLTPGGVRQREHGSMSRGAGGEGIDPSLLEDLARYPYADVCWIGDDGYPVQTPATFSADAERGLVRVDATGLPLPLDRDVNFLVSHVRPKPGEGYDQRRYLSLWGPIVGEGPERDLPSPAQADGLRPGGERQREHSSMSRGVGGEGSYTLRPDRAWGWDEKQTNLFELSERSNQQAKRYMEELSVERGVDVKPRLSRFWTFFLATRLPFLTATLVPVLLGIAIAASDGFFDWWFAIATVIAGAAIHIGLNVANDIFDTLSGADDANVTPTQFSGGSRVIQYGIVSLRQMIAIAAVAYAVGIGLGLYLVVARGGWELLAIGMAGVFISVFYTAPPFRLVHHGLGEVAVALGFGPVMVLGAYVVQAQQLSWEAFLASIPVAILIALVLYVNEVPDRPSDAAAGKRTLPVRWSPALVTMVFLVAAFAAFVLIAVAGVTGAIARPALLALLAAPLAWQVYQGFCAEYDDPYGLMPTMARNVALHLVAGLLLFSGYIVVIVADRMSESPPGFLT